MSLQLWLHRESGEIKLTRNTSCLDTDDWKLQVSLESRGEDPLKECEELLNTWQVGQVICKIGKALKNLDEHPEDDGTNLVDVIAFQEGDFFNDVRNH